MHPSTQTACAARGFAFWKLLVVLGVLIIGVALIAGEVVWLSQANSSRRTARLAAENAPPASEPATQPAAAPPMVAATADSLRRAAHEQSAMIALEEIKALCNQGDFERAAQLAQQGLQDYADTASAPEMRNLLASSQQQLAAQRDAQARQAAQDQASADARQARQDRFVQFREDGITAFSRKDYPAAILAFQYALREQDDAQVRDLLQQCIDATTAPRIAVADFAVSGNVGIPQAGATVAELLLMQFNPARFDLVERAHLWDIFHQQGLSTSDVANNPASLQGRDLEGLRYLVVGTISRLGYLDVSARLVDVRTGQTVQTAEVAAYDPAMLQDALADLAAMLQMSPGEKQAFLDQRRQEQAELAARRQQSQQPVLQPVVQPLQPVGGIIFVPADPQRRSQDQEHRRHEREKDAVGALAELESLLHRGEFERARRLARQCLAIYSDSPLHRDFAEKLALAEDGLDHQQHTQPRNDPETRPATKPPDKPKPQQPTDVGPRPIIPTPKPKPQPAPDIKPAPTVPTVTPKPPADVKPAPVLPANDTPHPQRPTEYKPPTRPTGPTTDAQASPMSPVQPTPTLPAKPTNPAPRPIIVPEPARPTPSVPAPKPTTPAAPSPTAPGTPQPASRPTVTPTAAPATTIVAPAPRPAGMPLPIAPAIRPRPSIGGDPSPDHSDRPQIHGERSNPDTPPKPAATTAEHPNPPPPPPPPPPSKTADSQPAK